MNNFQLLMSRVIKKIWLNFQKLLAIMSEKSDEQDQSQDALQNHLMELRGEISALKEVRFMNFAMKFLLQSPGVFTK